MTEHEQDKEKKTFTFFVDNVKFETDQKTVTGAFIKAMVPGFDRSYQLFLENPGNDPDELINDDTTVELDKKHGPARFYSVPPATFGLR